MKKTLFFVVGVLTIYAYGIACSKSDDDDGGKTNAEYISATDCTGTSPTYTADIKPILDAKCASSGCHGGSAPAHGLNLSTYELTKRDFNVHALICSIKQDSGCDAMPQGGSKLGDGDIKKIICWAKNGFVQ